MGSDGDNMDWGPTSDMNVFTGAAKEYGTSTTFKDKFDCDQYVGERIKNYYYPFASRDKLEWEVAAYRSHFLKFKPFTRNLFVN